MKKLFITIMGLLVMASCGQKSRFSSADDEREELKLKEYSYSNAEGIAHVDIKLEYPVSGDDELVDAIRLYVAEKIELESDEVELTDGQGMVDFYGSQLMGELSSMVDDSDNIDAFDDESYNNWNFTKLCETDDYITFNSETNIYWAGSAHGIDYVYGVTFFKEDGTRLTKQMLKDTESEEFQKLLREGLRDYFSDDGEELSDEELAEELIAIAGADVPFYEGGLIPLPRTDPYITSSGVHFIYMPYEISYYAAGEPEVIIPISKMRPFLNSKAKDLMDFDEDDAGNEADVD